MVVFKNVMESMFSEITQIERFILVIIKCFTISIHEVFVYFMIGKGCLKFLFCSNNKFLKGIITFTATDKGPLQDQSSKFEYLRF